jgi:Zn-dependent protease with chaperone function
MQPSKSYHTMPRDARASVTEGVELPLPSVTQLVTPPGIGRAIVVATLLIACYALVILAVIGLIAAVYMTWGVGNPQHTLLIIGGIVVGSFALRAIKARRDTFRYPGPRLEPSEQPQLFNVLSQVARATGQSMPDEVYLHLEMNAWVTRRGGLFGMGGRRVMGIGLPLLQLLSVSQFRAVMAHEFGHYHTDRIRFGAWIYQPRTMLAWTLRGLSPHATRRQPFLWYARTYTSVFHALVRRQEFIADEIASRAVGAGALIGGLQRVHGAAHAFEMYWSNEVAPALSAGFRLPLAEGFGRFVASQQVADAISRNLSRHLANTQTTPYDTHPLLSERIAAAERFTQESPTDNDPSAISLLNALPELELQLFAVISGEDRAHTLRLLAWEDVGVQMHLPTWQHIVQQNAGALVGLTVGALPEIIVEASASSRQHRTLRTKQQGASRSFPLSARRTAGVLGAALAVALYRHGWRLNTPPGGDITLCDGAIEIRPFEVVQRLAGGRLSAEAWRVLCCEAAIRDLELTTG